MPASKKASSSSSAPRTFFAPPALRKGCRHIWPGSNCIRYRFPNGSQRATTPLDRLCLGEIPSGPFQPLDRQALAELLLIGGYPEALSKAPRSRNLWFASYLEGRLLKDFESTHQAKGDYHSKLTALVRSLAGLSGNLVKYASIAGDLSQDDKTVKRYMEVLELMFIIRRRHPNLRNSAKQGVIGMPKLHFLDTGLACHLLGEREPEHLHLSHFFGALIETLVCGELLKHATWANDQVHIHHFRDNRKSEIDLVIERGDGKVVGIEVKASMTVGPQDFTGLSAFADYVDSRFLGGFLYYSGETVLPFRLRGRLFHALPLSSLWMH